MNIKKYTITKKRISLFLVIFTVFYIFGCAPKQTPPAIIPPPPKQTESALPNVKKIIGDVDNTIQTNTKIGDRLDESKQAVLDQKVSIMEALSQAEKIKEKALAKQAITELEALNLINELKKVETRNLFLEKQNEQLSKLKNEQDKILNIIQKTLQETEDQIYSKEEEARLLREQNIYLSQHLQSKNQESENLKKLLQKEKEVSASAKVYKNWVIGLVSVFVAWVIIKNILMMYFPLTKFRI
jgi:predicted RNase H-like nuclease (RuvC/YqgF family)